MWFTFICFSIALLIYLVCGITLAVRIHDLAKFNYITKHEDIDDGVLWIVVIFWIPLAYIKLWKDGISGIFDD